MFQDKNKAPPLDILELKLKGLESRQESEGHRFHFYLECLAFNKDFEIQFSYHDSYKQEEKSKIQNSNHICE